MSGMMNKVWGPIYGSRLNPKMWWPYLIFEKNPHKQNKSSMNSYYFVGGERRVATSRLGNYTNLLPIFSSGQFKEYNIFVFK